MSGPRELIMNELPAEFLEALRTIELHPDITDEAIVELADIIILEALAHDVILTEVEDYLYQVRDQFIRRANESKS
jgi:hypothetical protein